ncbi:MAG: methionyl-tRNA formyltransferase [bacterium]|nr:methionyl-tRNA formyltransferase [bacterium]
MKYIFFGGGQSEFAQIILDGLKNAGWEPLASIRDARQELDIPYLKSLEADIFIVASFAKILKKEIIDIPKYGVIGVHPSLLPKYRGASPIQSVLLADEKETGTALFLIDEKIDHGLILSKVKCPMSNSDTYETLLKKLAELSANLILDTLPKYLSGELKPQAQDEQEATYTKKFVTEDGFADLQKDNPKDIWLKIRALNPEPGVYTILELKNGKIMRLKLLSADFQDEKLVLQKVQPEGKKPMSYKEFLNGYQKILI